MTAAERLAEIEARAATARPTLIRPLTYPDLYALDQIVIHDVPALVAALRAVLTLHAPKAPASAWDMVSWTSCSCGAMEVTSRVDGAPSVAPAEYPCPTVRAITAALDGAL